MRALLLAAALLLTGAAAASAGTISTLAGKVAPGVEVHCRPLGGSQGQSYEYEDGTFEPLIDLSLETCRALTRLVEHRMRDDGATGANALETLLHEAAHLSLPTGDEAVAECAGLDALPGWLDRLGYHGARRHVLISLAWQAHLELPAVYLGGCKPPWPVGAVVITSVEPIKRPGG